MNLLTTQEVMDLLKVRRNTVYKLREAGMPYIKLGRTVRYERDDVIDWVRSCKTRDEVAAEPRDVDDVDTGPVALLPLRRPVDDSIYIL